MNRNGLMMKQIVTQLATLFFIKWFDDDAYIFQN